MRSVRIARSLGLVLSLGPCFVRVRGVPFDESVDCVRVHRRRGARPKAGASRPRGENLGPSVLCGKFIDIPLGI